MVKIDEFALHDQLKKFFGFNTFKGTQEVIIKCLLEGNDVFVIMPTGGGKSLCYQLPALFCKGTAIIVSPLIALMKNQVDSMRSFGTEYGIANFLNSSLTKQEVKLVKEDLLSGKTKLLYVAPETLGKEENVEFFKDVDISFYAIDEAHCISEWGHDFRPEYRRLRPMIDAIGKGKPVIALTATATPKVQVDIQKNLGMQQAKLFISSFNRPNLHYEVKPRTKDVDKDIVRYIKSNPGKSGIIYCLSRKKVEEVAIKLQVNGIRALPYHAGMESALRTQTQDKFLMEEIEVIVATIAFGMGIDKPDVRFVMHYNIPKSLEGYYQETGRAGRDDGEGVCIAYYDYSDIEKLEKFLQDKPVAEQEISQFLLSDVVAYAESSVCRRKFLLHYFGEETKEENCHSCDNCNNPKIQYDGREHIELVLNVINAVKQQFKEKYIISIILGKNNATLKQYKHNKLSFFGKGADYDERFWSNVIRQALIAKLLIKDIENYGVMKLSDDGKEFLEEPYSIKIVKEHGYGDDDDLDDDDAMFLEGGQKITASDKVLFALLKDIRKELARKEKLPPFVIFQDPSLEDMALHYPITIDELTQISGVGTGKAQKYGAPFLELIAKYVEENEIFRPSDFVIKSVINKSELKVYIIQSIDRKLGLEDIAMAKGLTITELLTEIERIVSSGTKVNISYYIEEYIDEYHQKEIFEYFNEAESDSVEDALKELGEEEFSEEEIRLMRIKFMSDVGN